MSKTNISIPIFFQNAKQTFDANSYDNTKQDDEKVRFVINNNTIHSLKELRENFEAEAILNAHIDGTLATWLEQHYYEKEFEAVSNISTVGEPKCLQKLCAALGVDYADAKNMSAEEKQQWEERREIVSGLSSDPQILSELYLVALNQEELAKLLDQEVHKIYLCQECFSIPIRIPNVEYIKLGNATLEHPYTKEQYEKAGIQVSGFTLPDSVDEDSASLAREATAANGYDDFQEHHTPLATLFHNQLKTHRLSNTHYIPFNDTVGGKFFHSKQECEEAKNNCIRKAYNEAEKYVTTGSSKSLSKEAANYYGDIIEKTFSAIKDKLEALSNINAADDAYNTLIQLVKYARKNLLREFEEELNDNRDYYAMYDFNYFKNQVEIEEHDYRMAEDFFTKALETLFTDSIQYTVTDVHSAISEIQDDLHNHANTFFGTVHHSYQEYVAEMESLLDQIGKDLPKASQDETIDDYINRCFVKKAV